MAPLKLQFVIQIVDYSVMMPSSSSSGYVASVNALDMFDKLGTSPFPTAPSATSALVPSSLPQFPIMPPSMGFPFDALNVSSSSVAIASPSQTPTVVTTVGTVSGTEDFVVLPGKSLIVIRKGKSLLLET